MSLKRQAIINTAGLILSLFVDWLIMMIIPILSGYELAGHYSYAYSISTIFAIIQAYSLRNYQVITGFGEIEEKKYFGAQFYTCVIGYTAAVIFLLVSEATTERMILIPVLMIMQTVTYLCCPMYASLQMVNRLDIPGKSGIYGGVIKILGFGIGYFLTKDSIIAVIVMVLSSSVFFLAYVCYAYRKITGRKIQVDFHLDRFSWMIIKDCTPITLSTILPIIIGNMPKFYLDSLCGTKELGYYTTLTSVTQVVPSVIMGLSAPTLNLLANIYRENRIAELRKKARRILIIIGVCGAAGCCALMVPGHFFYKFVYGEELMPFIKVFYISTFAMLFLGIGNYIITILMLFRKNYMEMGISAVILGLSFFVVRYFITKMSTIGAALSLLILYFVFCILNLLTVVYLFNKKEKGAETVRS